MKNETDIAIGHWNSRDEFYSIYSMYSQCELKVAFNI